MRRRLQGHCEGAAGHRLGVGTGGRLRPLRHRLRRRIGYKTATSPEPCRCASNQQQGDRGDTGDPTAASPPLSRFYLYLNYKPGTELDPLRAEFVRSFSKDGQLVVVKAGFYPILKPIADKALGQLNLAAKPAGEKPAGADGKNK